MLVLKDFGAHLISMFWFCGCIMHEFTFPSLCLLIFIYQKNKMSYLFYFMFYIVLQGSEKLLQLVSDSSSTLNSSMGNENETKHDGSKYGIHNSVGTPWVS